MMGILNEEVSLSSQIPSGHCNAAFGLSGSWAKDDASVKVLAFDGMFIALYSLNLRKSQWEMHHQVKRTVPTMWDPAALARFIRKFGTHVIVGDTLGGKAAVYARQYRSSNIQSYDMKRMLTETVDKIFSNLSQANSLEAIHTSRVSQNDLDIEFMYRRKGGSKNKILLHKEWLHTVESEPDILSVSFIPLTFFLTGIPGNGFVSHAINLYLRYKPPVEELQQFLEFQVPRQWAPIFGQPSLGCRWKLLGNEYLKFGLIYPKLFISTNPVDVGERPVTGMRLFLEGRESNYLAIHLHHLSSLPTFIHFSENSDTNFLNCSHDHKYYRKVQWRSFSHICTAPVESAEDLSIVTGARLKLGNYGLAKVLFLCLRFSKVIGATLVKQPEWDNPPILNCSSKVYSADIGSTSKKTDKEKPKPGDVTISSATYPSLPTPVNQPKLLRFVDPTEMIRGPQDTPGYWVVSGARLVIKNGKIGLQVKYSLLNFMMTAAKVSP